MIDFEAPPPRFAVLWSAGVGVAVVPRASRCGSRVIASVVIIHAIKKVRWDARGALTHR